MIKGRQKRGLGPLAVKAASQLGVTRRTIYRWADRGITPEQIKLRLVQVQAETGGAELFTVRQAMTRFGVSRSTVYRWFAEGEVDGVEVFGLIRLFIKPNPEQNPEPSQEQNSERGERK